MRMINFAQFSWLSFDCYGTLIDWETCILDALRPLFAARGRHLSDDGILELYAQIEAREEAGEYRPYREVLENVVRRISARMVLNLSDHEAGVLVRTIGTWPPFADSVDALARLKQRYKLAVISNVDDDLFSGSSHLLGDPFDLVVTAQQARSYKPSRRNFELALEKIGEPAGHVLHCAQSRYHDIPPAKELGMGAVWVDRRAGKHGQGAVAPSPATPDLTVPDLQTLAELALA